MNKEDINKSAQLIKQGDMQSFFNIYHSYYSLSGVIVGGNGIGHKIGFPTANIFPDPQSTVPQKGVYAVFVSLESKILKGMLNIGIRPTFNLNEVTIEVHLFDFSETIYNHRITVFFVDRIRDEVKFESKELLIEQLKDDRHKISEILQRSTPPQK